LQPPAVTALPVAAATALSVAAATALSAAKATATAATVPVKVATRTVGVPSRAEAVVLSAARGQLLLRRPVDRVLLLRPEQHV
jgi:hypothetical protein